MATQFLFNPQEVDRIAKNLEKKASSLQSIQRELKTAISKVNSWWEGESQTAYIEQYNNFEPSLTQLSELANAISKQLAEIASLKMENEGRRAKMFK